MDFRPARSGEKLAIKAEEWNEVRRVSSLTKSQSFLDGARFSKKSRRDAGTIKVRNSSSETIEQGTVVGLGDPLFPPIAGSSGIDANAFLSDVIVEAVGVDPELHRYAFGVVVRPIPPDALGDVIVSGIVQALVTVSSDDDERASLQVGNTLLTDSDGDVTVLWIAPGSETERWALVMVPAAATAAAAPSVLKILGGNNLSGGGVGIKKIATLIASGDITGKDPGVRASVGAITRSLGIVTAVAAPADVGTARGTVYADSQVGAACFVSGGGGTGCVVTIGSITAGKVTSYTVVNGGTGYTSNPSITPPQPTGTPAGLPWPDGLGYGTINNGQRVLIGLDILSPIAHALPSNALVPMWNDSNRGYYTPFWY